MTENKKNAPIQSFKDGAVTIKLWEQQAGNRSFVNASIGKLYKDEKSGQWRESRSFNGNDLLKLQNLLPEAQKEFRQWQDYFNTINPEAEKEVEPRKNEALAKRDALLAEKQQTMAEARDAAMSQATREDGDRTQEHAPSRENTR